MTAASIERYKVIIQALDHSDEHASDQISGGLDGLLLYLYLSHLIEEAVYRGVKRALAETNTAQPAKASGARS